MAGSSIASARHARGTLAAALIALCVTVAPACRASAAMVPAELSHPRQFEVDLHDAGALGVLLRAGLDVVAIHGATATVFAWPRDEERLAALGFAPHLIDADPGATAAARARADLGARPAPGRSRVTRANARGGRAETQSLPPFAAGSMGGYWNSREIKLKLDQLVADDTHDWVADQIDTVGWSRGGRPIWGLAIGHGVHAAPWTLADSGAARPAVFFNALTHAREPGGMQALFCFIDDLLAKGDSDPLAAYLLERRTVYIVPLVNPDGYAANEATYSATGSFGLWRKNERDNNANGVFDALSDGVDLNRNYGFRWGADNEGSSADPGSEIFRGPSPFSEPESRAQRDLVAALRPVTGFSFHTYSDLLIHPWGHTTTPTPDAAAYDEWSDAMTRDNAFLSGPAPAILYTVNGEFNDWCYGDTLTKPRAFTWTPEIGSDVDGFWPPPSRIVPLAQEMLRPCYLVAAIAGPYVVKDGVTLLEGAMNAGRLTNVVVNARNLGARGDTGPGLTGTMTAVDAGARVLNGTVLYPPAAPRTTVAPLGAGAFQVALDDTVTPGRMMRFAITFTSADGFGCDTIRVPAGTPTVVYADDASNGLAGWNGGAWGIVSGDPAHASRYFADSPAGCYAPSTNNRMILRARLDLSRGVHAYALYDARWELEQNDDGATIEASFDSLSWKLLHGTGTTPASGSGAQILPGQPYYAGSRRGWANECADLSGFTGKRGWGVKLRFRLQSDGRAQYDGFAFDSLRVIVFDPAVQPRPLAAAEAAAGTTIDLAPPAPNPARHGTRFEFAIPAAARVALEVFDIHGRRVRVLARESFAPGRYARAWNLDDDAGGRVSPGIYLARLQTPTATAVRRVVVAE